MFEVGSRRGGCSSMAGSFSSWLGEHTEQFQLSWQMCSSGSAIHGCREHFHNDASVDGF